MHRIICLLGLAALSPLPAFAAESVDYSYLDLALVNQDGPGDDFEGIGGRFSVPFNAQFYGKIELALTSADDIDRTDVLLGGGYRMPLNRHTDFIAEVDFVDVNTDAGDDDGLRLGAGVRSLVAQQLELRGVVRYVDLGDGELVIDLGAEYLINTTWSAFLEMSEGDDYGGYLIGARYDF